MPIGIVTDAQLAEELARLEKKTPQSKIIDIPKGGRDDSPNTPDSLRKVIAEDALLNGRQSALNLANQFGISPSSVSAYARGATSTATYNSPVNSLISHINKSRQRAVKRASKTLNAALSAITQEKLDYADASDLSGIAKDMSVIIKNLEPDKAVDASPEAKAPQFVIYAPQFKQENSFETIQVTE